MPMHIQLKDFDGPLDLLLQLIGKAKIDIKDIFVSQITDQYIESVNNAVDLDMDDATSFLVMAATLLEIKSRSMLPRPPQPADPDEISPEEALIRQLQEYKVFKETAENMQQFEKAAASMYRKLPEEYPLPPPSFELTGLTLQGLVEAFARVYARKPEQDEPEGKPTVNRDIQRDSHTVPECMLHILKGLKRKGQLTFEELVSDAPTKEEVVTLFLALLEILRLGKAHISQNGVYETIMLYPGRSKDIAVQ